MTLQNEENDVDDNTLVKRPSNVNKFGMEFDNKKEAMAVTGRVKDGAQKPETLSGSNDPAMDRLQNALKAQLVKTRDRIQYALQEEEDNSRQVKKGREDCGVELYGMQQQLAQIQNKLDETEERHSNHLNKRQRIDEKLFGLRKELKTQSLKKGDLARKALERKYELDKAESSLRQAQKFNKETKREVAITKRAASKAEETVKGAVKGKETQDVYIDGLNQQIRRLETELALVAKELNIQKKQTTESDAMIKGMSIELEALSSEKKRLVQQWNSTILALGRRDHALTAATKAVRQAQNAAKDNTSEMIGLKRDFFNLSLDREKREFDRSKIQNELKFLDENIHKARNNEESLASQIELISKIIIKTQDDCSHEERAAKRHISSTTALGHKIEAISSERRALEEKIGTYKEEYAAVSQAAMSVVKQDKVIISKIHEKEIDTGTIDNELARVKIDVMNTTVHCSQLKDRLINEMDDLNEKDKAVANLQMEVRRSHDDIESKMNKVDRLNRKYEQMASDIEEEEPLGPLEASIKSLERQIQTMDGQSRRLQEEWVANQAKLITSIEKTETFEAEKLQKTATLTILKQKRLRLLQDIHTNKASLRDVEARTKSMHTDMSRLNELIGGHSQMRAKLVNGNGVSEIEFAEEIKEIQNRIMKIEKRNVNAQSAKEELLKQILEKEKVILVWGKKIQLEKETQIALNSSEHADEIKGMEIEIHRMRHRLEEMNRQQEKLIRDMELAIHKREDIAVKYQNTKQGQMHDAHPQTIAGVRRRLGDLNRQIKRNKNEKEALLSKECESRMRTDSLETTVDAVKKDLGLEDNQNQTLQHELNALLFEKQRMLMKSTRLKELLGMYCATSDPLLDDPKDRFTVQKRLSVIDTKISRIKNAIAGLRIQHVQYDEVFQRVNIMANDISHISEVQSA